MDNSITIRTCTLKDADTLVSLGIRTFRDTFDEMNTAENMMLYINSAFTTRRIKEELQQPGSVFFIAESDHHPIGYARIRPNKQAGLEGSVLEVERLYVDKRYIGGRIGYLLMNTCLQHAVENNFDVVCLGVWEYNARAIAFYEKWGFEKFGQHIFMLGKEAQNDLLMKKTLK